MRRRSNLRWQTHKLHAVSSEIFHAIVLDLVGRKLLHVRSERVLAPYAEELDVVDHVRRGPEVVIERLGQSADVDLLDVRVLAHLFVVEVVLDTPPRQFESLADVLDGVDHHAKLQEARFGGVAGHLRLEREVHLLEDVVSRDVAPLAACHAGSAPVIPDFPARMSSALKNSPMKCMAPFFSLASRFTNQSAKSLTLVLRRMLNRTVPCLSFTFH